MIVTSQGLEAAEKCPSMADIDAKEPPFWAGPSTNNYRKLPIIDLYRLSSTSLRVLYGGIQALHGIAQQKQPVVVTISAA